MNRLYFRVLEKSPKMAGILLVIFDSLCFSLMTLMVRIAGPLPTMQKTLFRNLIAGLIAVITLTAGKESFRLQKKNVPDLLFRSIFGGLGMIANFWAIDHLSLADANLLNKLSPFWAIVASIFILSEIPRKKEILYVILAFLGAAFVVKPTAGIASLPALVALLGGMGAGIAYTFVRKLGMKGERGSVIVAFFSIFTCLLCLPFVILDYHPMSLYQWGCLLGAGLFAALAQFSVTRAYKLAPAKEISVFDYSQVLFASLWGILFFAELPDAWSLLGYAIVIATAIAKWNYTRKIA